MKQKGLTASDLKYIAILAMFIDHVAWLAVPTESVLGQVMHAIGRTTAPVMCFFLTEGFHYTRNFRKYVLRMGVFAVISHFAYCFYKTGQFFAPCKESVITTFLLCLLCLWVYHHQKIPNVWKFVAILGLTILSQSCDWGSKAVLFTFAFALARGNRKHQLAAFAAVAFLTLILPLWDVLLASPDLFVHHLYKFGIFLPIPLLLCYNGQRGGSNATKWLFYIFYPAHLLVLGLISVLYL